MYVNILYVLYIHMYKQYKTYSKSPPKNLDLFTFYRETFTELDFFSLQL